jgi:hypothetical protein
MIRRPRLPLYVGPIPSADQYAIEGTRWNQFVTAVQGEDIIVETKKRLSVFYPADLAESPLRQFHPGSSPGAISQ